MSPVTPPLPQDVNAEVGALIETLRQTEQRLKALTGGELDSVADSGGRTFLLQHAQEQLVLNEAAKQASILNALPAHIALLDPHGNIISVNEAWRRFADSNTLQGPEHGLGLNYLDACDSAAGDSSTEAHQVAVGIRTILSGEEKKFSLEYPCHTPTEQSWFLMTVMPLPGNPPQGAVVMHVNVTAERQAEEKLRISESRFRQMAENIRDVFFLIDAQSGRMLYISPAYEETWGRSNPPGGPGRHL
jgi:PAS domain-containing protein